MSERPGPRGPSSGAPPLDAGTLGMIVFVVALSMFFVASVAVNLVNAADSPTLAAAGIFSPCRRASG